MSANTACVTCREVAPLLGDSGFLGYPSTEHGPHSHEDLGEIPGFGYFHVGLEGIHLVTAEVSAYMAFLKAHQGHQIHLSLGNGDEPEGFEEALAAADYSALVAAQESVPPGFSRATMTYACDECGEELVSPEDTLRTVARAVVPPAAALEAAKWLSAAEMEGDWCHGLMGALDPFGEFMMGLGAFLNAHAAHGIRATVGSAQ